MTRPKLSAQPRSVQGKSVKHLRGDGVLPAVVYGRGVESTMIQVDSRELDLIRRRSGRNALVDLSVDGGKPTPVLLHHIQEHPVTRRPLHVDFLAVAMTEEMTVDVPVSAVGTAEAVDRMGGILLLARETVQVRTLPDNLPSFLELDITPLDSFEAVLRVGDLRVPDGVTVLTEAGETLARVQAPRVEEAATPTSAAEGEAEEGPDTEAAEAAADAGGAEPAGEEESGS
ncbi:MAG TPA: 50S ribosomal protein L25 [Candidatus Limnocylindrales bacterium]|nr:50S ribosomal protein L25 [Candidatus Limnocylindrales bacterium]